MPHQCTNCGQTFSDGSKEMLSGCPGCGGNKFQYLPEGSNATPPDEEPPDRFEPAGTSGSVTEKMARAATTVEDYVANRRDDESFFDEPTEDHGAESSEADIAGDRSKTDVQDGDPESTRDRSTASPERDAASRSAEPSPPDTDEFDDGVELSRGEREDEDTAQASARGSFVDETDLPRESSEEPTPSSSGPPSDGHVVKEPTTDARPDLETLRSELNDQFESIRIVEPGQYELNLMGLYDREEYIISLQEDGKYVVEIPEGWGEDEDSDGE